MNDYLTANRFLYFWWLRMSLPVTGTNNPVQCVSYTVNGPFIPILSIRARHFEEKGFGEGGLNGVNIFCVRAVLY